MEFATGHRFRHAGRTGKAQRQSAQGPHREITESLRFHVVAFPAEIFRRKNAALQTLAQHRHEHWIAPATAANNETRGHAGYMRKAAREFAADPLGQRAPGYVAPETEAARQRAW